MSGGPLPVEHIRKLHNKRIFGKVLLGREPYVFREPKRDDKGVIVGFTPKITGVSYQYVIVHCPAPRRLIVTGRGIGKSEIIIGNEVPFKALLQPYFDQVGNFLHRPLPQKIILLGNLRETARKLQEKVRRDCLSHPWLESLVAEHTQTELEARNGSHIYVRTAGNDGSSARGLHSEILTNERGESVKGKIHAYLDEAAFMRAPRVIEEVIEPMMILNPNSTVTITTTPYGEEGEVWRAWSDPTSMDCLQKSDVRPMTVERLSADGERYYRDEPFKMYPGFDPELCKVCLQKRGWKRFNVATADNPFMVPEALWDRKNSLLRNGLELVWNQEHMGLFQKAAGLFFPPSTWLKMLDDSATFITEDLLLTAPTRLRGKFLLGLDSSSGIVTKGADFTALWLWEEILERGELHYYARMIYRWKKPPPVWGGRSYNESDLLTFVIHFVRWLRQRLSIRRTTVGSGFGQGIYEGTRHDGEGPVDYFTDSETQLTSLFVWFRALAETGRIHLPPDCAPGGSHEWMSQEAGRLGITEGTARGGLNFKVYKMAGWGSGKTVDGLFAGAYGLAPTVQVVGDGCMAVVQRQPVVDSVRSVGEDGGRELGVAGVRELTV